MVDQAEATRNPIVNDSLQQKLRFGATELNIRSLILVRTCPELTSAHHLRMEQRSTIKAGNEAKDSRDTRTCYKTGGGKIMK